MRVWVQYGGRHAHVACTWDTGTVSLALETSRMVKLREEGECVLHACFTVTADGM